MKQLIPKALVRIFKKRLCLIGRGKGNIFSVKKDNLPRRTARPYCILKNPPFWLWVLQYGCSNRISYRLCIRSPPTVSATQAVPLFPPRSLKNDFITYDIQHKLYQKQCVLSMVFRAFRHCEQQNYTAFRPMLLPCITLVWKLCLFLQKAVCFFITICLFRLFALRKGTLRAT